MAESRVEAWLRRCLEELRVAWRSRGGPRARARLAFDGLLLVGLIALVQFAPRGRLGLPIFLGLIALHIGQQLTRRRQNAAERPGSREEASWR